MSKRFVYTAGAAALALTQGLALSGCLDDDSISTPPEELGGEEALERAAAGGNLDLVPYDLAPRAAKRAAALPLEQRSREELAEALRPVVFDRDGKVYTTREPNWEAADTVPRDALAMVRAQAAGAEPTPDRFEDPAPGDLTALPRIIGTDGRTRVTNTTVAPFRAMARVFMQFSNGSWGQCSGTYVGPWTFVLAGHCIRESSGAVARRMIFEPARNGSLLPFGSFDCRNDDASSSNNFLAAIPSGYVSTADPNLDMAVVDTWPCHRAPNWMGQPATNQGVLVNPGNTTYALHGYPGDPPSSVTCPGSPTGGTTLCGMSGSAYVNGSWVETEHIDSSPGQSGGPWHIGGRVAATHIGYREYFDLFRCGFDVCRRNYGRRMDATYKSFLDAISFDYP
ncbi:MAG: hypothetical protein K8M05_15055 [Deltaproteobacteria bacterium]|nr:hypothetical protein [Kofleriaceae bacterium]